MDDDLVEQARRIQEKRRAAARALSRGRRTAGGGGIAGILDAIPTALAAYSFRKLRSAYAGPCCRIRRSSDNAETDIGFSGAAFDSGTAAAFIGGGSGFIAVWYDQSGNGYDAVQATAGKQPTYVASGIGGKPSAAFDRDSSTSMATGVGEVAFNGSNVTLFGVFYASADWNQNARVLSFTGAGNAADWNNQESFSFTRDDVGEGLRTFQNNVDGSDVTITHGTPNVIGHIFDGTNGTMYKDGVSGGAVAYNSAAAPFGDAVNGNSITLGEMAISNGSFFDGQMSEMIVWPSDQTTNVVAIDTNMGNYYGL